MGPLMYLYMRLIFYLIRQMNWVKVGKAVIKFKVTKMAL